MPQAASWLVRTTVELLKPRTAYLAALLLPILALGLQQGASPQIAEAQPATHYQATLSVGKPGPHNYYGCDEYFSQYPDMSCADRLTNVEGGQHNTFTYGGTTYTIIVLAVTQSANVKLRVTPHLTNDVLEHLMLRIGGAIYPFHHHYRASLQHLTKNLDLPPGTPGRNAYLLNNEESVVRWSARWTWDTNSGFRSYNPLSRPVNSAVTIKLTDWPQPTKRITNLRVASDEDRKAVQWSHTVRFDLQAPLSAGKSFVLELPGGYTLANPDQMASKLRMQAIPGPDFASEFSIGFSQVRLCTTTDTPPNCGAAEGALALRLTVSGSWPGSMVPRSTQNIWWGFRPTLGLRSPSEGGAQTWRVRYDDGPWATFTLSQPKWPTTPPDSDEPHAELIAQVWQWRNDPCCVDHRPHTERWDRVLLALGETINDQTLEPMTAAEAQAYADRGWTRWDSAVEALRELEAGEREQNPQQVVSQTPPNQAPTLAASLADVVIAQPGRTRTVSLAGTFSDPDGDPLTITAASSNTAVATVSVAAGGSSLTLNAQARGAATITVTADDGNGGTVSDDFRATVKSAPFVSVTLADLSGLEAGTSREVSLSGIFSDHDHGSLTITASSSNQAVAQASVASDGSTLTVTAVAEGAATITVTARDSDANQVSDDFTVSVTPAPQPDPTPTVDLPDIVARYDANGDGVIDRSEYRQAHNHYIADRISYAELMQVVRAYLKR